MLSKTNTGILIQLIRLEMSVYVYSIHIQAPSPSRPSLKSLSNIIFIKLYIVYCYTFAMDLKQYNYYTILLRQNTALSKDHTLLSRTQTLLFINLTHLLMNKQFLSRKYTFLSGTHTLLFTYHTLL